MASPDPPHTAATAATTAAPTTSSTTTAATTSATVPPIRTFSKRPLPALPADPMAIVRYPPAQIPNPNPYRYPRIRAPNPQFPKPHEPPQGILYPVASSGRGFIPKPLRPQSSDNKTVTVANPGAAFPPRSAAATAAPLAHQTRPFGFPQSDLSHPVHSVRIPHLHPSHTGVTAVPGSAPVKGISVSAQSKVAPSPSSVSDCNGYKDSRNRNQDDAFVTIRERKVRISDGSSIYALCRSWLRNGFSEETQPQHYDSMKSLPRPLSIPVTDPNLPKKKENVEEEDEESVENLLAQDLLQRHIKRAKKVRAKLREQRLKRIARYKTRLALLLPPPVDQFRSDTGAGN